MSDNHTSCELSEKPVQKKCVKTILYNALSSFCNSFAKGIALVCSAFIFLFFCVSIVLAPSETKHTTLKVLPNQDWKVKSFSKENDTLLKISISGPIGIGSGVKKTQIYNTITDLYNLGLNPKQFKGIILNINTPGGTVDDSDAIMRLLLEVKKNWNIPIYAYVDSLCCSGGMLIALASDSITASSPSVIGSVGIIMGTAFNYSSTMQRLGIDAITLHSGKGKDELNPFRTWSPDEGTQHQVLLDSYYERFISLVSEHRPNLTKEKLKEIGAQVFTAKDALEIGYIDEINDSWTDFLAQVAQKTGCNPSYQLIELTPNASFAEILAGNTTMKDAVQHHIRVPGDVHPDAYGKPLFLEGSLR